MHIATIVVPAAATALPIETHHTTTPRCSSDSTTGTSTNPIHWSAAGMQDPLRALIFDSYYDPYRGVVCQFRVVDGKVSKGDTVVMMNTGKEYTLDEIGVLAPVKTPVSWVLVVFKSVTSD
eukprot:GHUV01026568.1.p1 GENE.GHUV01026568.1~~GHUV01026568.1.p1  ORF type:complete len:121 (+),score=22.66 GHUV01026568.1:343-705(+)